MKNKLKRIIKNVIVKELLPWKQIDNYILNRTIREIVEKIIKLLKNKL